MTFGRRKRSESGTLGDIGCLSITHGWVLPLACTLFATNQSSLDVTHFVALQTLSEWWRLVLRMFLELYDGKC
jgi:hypothetical protein